MHRAKVLDFDGTIIRRTGCTLLEQLMLDFYKVQDIPKKADLLIRSAAVKLYRTIASNIGKIFNDHLITGETTSLQVFDILLLSKAKMPITFVEERAKEYSKKLKPKHIAAFKKCKDDLYIVSAEPVQLLEAVVKEAGISNCIKGIYGTKFKLKDDIIVGFERASLFAGVRGKYFGMYKIVSNGYSEIHAIGDSMADIGLFEEYKGKVIPYTFNDAPQGLIEYVKKNGGFVVESLDQFF